MLGFASLCEVPLSSLPISGIGFNPQSIAVPAAAVVVAAPAPSVSRTTNTNPVAITVPAAPVVVAAGAPTITRTTTVVGNGITAPTADVVVAAGAPTVSRTTNTNPVAITAPAAAVTVAANAPTITRTALNYISVPSANVTVFAEAPTITVSGIVLPPSVLAEMYGGGAMYPRKKKKKKPEEPSIETMVRAIADDPKGKLDVIKILPPAARPDPGIAALYQLVDKLEAATVPVQKKLEQLYRARLEEDDEDDAMFLLM